MNTQHGFTCTEKKRKIKNTKKKTMKNTNFESFLQKGLQGFEEQWCYVNVRGFDGAFQSGASNNCGEFNQEWDSSRDFRREVENILVPMLPFGNEEHIRRSQSFENGLNIVYKNGGEISDNFIRIWKGPPSLK